MTKTKAQIRAEAVERLKNCVAARFDAESIVIALTSGRHGQSDWSIECDKLIYLLTDDEPQDERDTRVRLEAEIRYEYNGSISNEAEQIIEWLDRQAAITERECRKPNWDYCETCEAYDRIAELKAELGHCKTWRNNFEQATEARKHWQRKYESVKAERDELQERVDNLCASEEIGNKLIIAQLETEAEQGRTIVEYAEKVDELEAENEQLRMKLSRAYDNAHDTLKVLRGDAQ